MDNHLVPVLHVCAIVCCPVNPLHGHTQAQAHVSPMLSPHVFMSSVLGRASVLRFPLSLDCGLPQSLYLSHQGTQHHAYATWLADETLLTLIFEEQESPKKLWGGGCTKIKMLEEPGFSKMKDQCRSKVKNLKTAYKKAKDNNQKSGRNGSNNIKDLSSSGTHHIHRRAARTELHRTSRNREGIHMLVDGLAAEGYLRTPKQVRAKFKALKHKYHKANEANRRSGSGRSS
ncbi:hypothetical protein Bbelb_341550 [Branchiostoma belcheri]|nr:hypothetical protein Bbelb_341550 [Branchiostoma belcheri]